MQGTTSSLENLAYFAYYLPMLSEIDQFMPLSRPPSILVWRRPWQSTEPV